MLRSALGGGLRPSIFPWSKSTMAEELARCFSYVYEQMRAAGRYEDIPLLRQGDTLKLASHSMRRGCTQRATDLIAERQSVADADALDAHCRWNEAMQDKVMRLRYGGEAAALRRIAVVEWF